MRPRVNNCNEINNKNTNDNDNNNNNNNNSNNKFIVLFFMTLLSNHFYPTFFFWLRFPAQPKLLFIYSGHPDVCTAIIINNINNNNKTLITYLAK